MRKIAIVLAAAALAVVPCLSSGEDDKKPSPRPKKVLTEDDLRRAGRGTVSQPGTPAEPDASASPSPDALPSPGVSPEPTEEEKRATAGKTLQRHMDHYAKEVAARRAQIEKAQLELNDLTD